VGSSCCKRRRAGAGQIAASKKKKKKKKKKAHDELVCVVDDRYGGNLYRARRNPHLRCYIAAYVLDVFVCICQTVTVRWGGRALQA